MFLIWLVVLNRLMKVLCLVISVEVWVLVWVVCIRVLQVVMLVGFCLLVFFVYFSVSVLVLFLLIFFLVRLMCSVVLVLMCLFSRIMCLVQFLLIRCGRFWVLLVYGSRLMVVFGSVIWVCFLMMCRLQVSVYFRFLFIVQLLIVVIDMLWKLDSVLKVLLKWCVVLCVVVLLLEVNWLRLVLVEKNFLFLLVIISVQMLWFVLSVLIRLCSVDRLCMVQVCVGGLFRVIMVVWLLILIFRFMCFWVC